MGEERRDRQYDEDAPTQVENAVEAVPRRPTDPPSGSDAGSGASTPATSRGGGTSASASLVTARETLGYQEIQRTRSFLKIAVAIAVMISSALPFVAGNPTAKAILACALVAVVVVCGRLLWLMRDDEAYSIPRAVTAGYSTILAAFAGIWFFGVFSPGAAIVPLGIYFFCAGQSDRASLAVYVTCALTYAAMTVGVLAGVVPDQGIVRGDTVPALARITMVVLVEGIFLAVYVIARRTREATISAIERHDIVIRSLAQRDALLREARHDLVQAMRIGGIGRYSGEVVGSFRLGNVIGRGAMGEVYEAVRLDTKEEAAVKLVHPQLLVEHGAIDRFVREAKVTSSLSVPNVVKILDAAGGDAPIPYIAMERLHGEDLASHLRDKKRMPLKRVVRMLIEVAAGIDAAHAAGIIHRDLKPRNVFCARPAGGAKGKEVWKVLDFGVSKLESGEGTLTHDRLVGTPAYMAPEQARGSRVGPLADVFALGVIAYRAITGAPPFTGDTNSDILFGVMYAMPLAPSTLVKMPDTVDSVLAVALAKDPNDRYASAGDFAKALDLASQGRIDDATARRARKLLEAMPWGFTGDSRPPSQR